MPLVRVRGRSMTPALRPGVLLWVRKTPTLDRGRIVLVKDDHHGLYLKRVIGLPGEEVGIRAGRVLINGVPLDEPYVPPTAYLEPKPDQTWSVERGTYILLGDARDDSLDSRRLGPVTADQIIGVAICRLWPPPFKL